MDGLATIDQVDFSPLPLALFENPVSGLTTPAAMT
ncbi:DNA segregation ATPase FtsK/SpoIIIE family [Zymobacter palmae]|uniref:DNA segregation ATPase FtsK/SpoIIIE family n=1 Tax=Zymobacter palmae TaxID=33074 RepID=A0A348HHM5_9GAMM|nr:DNA segregation ATPase FtsK/SpoIIIE family [Zymobacter palmae]